MTSTPRFDLDDTGKIDLNAIYDRPDPRTYYQTLVNLDYQIPAAAEPNFRTVIDARRRSRGKNRIALLDVGSSYGVNAALLKHSWCLSDLFRLYERYAERKNWSLEPLSSSLNPSGGFKEVIFMVTGEVVEFDDRL